MKTLILLLTLIVSTRAQAFLSHEEVMRSFAQPKQFSFMALPVRQHKLIPTALFLPKDIAFNVMGQELNSRANRFAGLPLSVDLRNRDSGIRDQGNEGLCTAFGLASDMENLIGQKQHTDLSEAHFWSLYREYSVDSAMDTALSQGIMDEQYWPYGGKKQKNSNKSALTHVTSSTYLSANIGAAVKALSKGLPLYVGLSTPNDLYNCDVTVQGNQGDAGGGHAVAVVGYRLDARAPGGGYFIVKNSWGKSCGDKGYQYMSFRHL
jgi:C1A family cysteine protease